MEPEPKSGATEGALDLLLPPIKKRLARGFYTHGDYPITIESDIADLIAEVERLRAAHGGQR